MIILLSPAKNVNEQRAAGQATTVPRFLDQAEELVTVARQWSEAEISAIMKVSPAIAELNRARFRAWRRDGDCAAGLMFDGDVYKELEFATLNDVARSDAPRRLRLLSGLYGLLRPTDGVCAYRLEMGRKCPGHAAGTLYKFWGSRIAEAIVQDAAAVDTDRVLNLASEEYGKAVNRDALGGLSMVSPRFEEDRGGVRRVIGIAAKRARGAMARWVLETGVTSPSDIEAFNVGGYAFDAASSTPEQPVFVRS
ncbi:YaaA family protein [Phaeobacter sp. B1627]|uniref:YaaA family protein n=1 Tax=Phaeobacter sp. B1627 TaxID=2583809 RepID=UPI0011180A8F|nr:YaaA family protein [Phaeobacter sp. B1627]TNJ41421.1 YaaA family protein [Phaeobacter sp. B1627]